MGIEDLIPDRNYAFQPFTGGFWYCLIQNAVSASDAKLYVKIPGISSELVFGPVKWAPRIDVDNDGNPIILWPKKGDYGCVVLNNNQFWWLLLWTPFGKEAAVTP